MHKAIGRIGVISQFEIGPYRIDLPVGVTFEDVLIDALPFRPEAGHACSWPQALRVLQVGCEPLFLQALAHESQIKSWDTQGWVFPKSVTSNATHAAGAHQFSAKLGLVKGDWLSLCGIRWRCLVHRKHRCRHGMPDGFSKGGHSGGHVGSHRCSIGDNCGHPLRQKLTTDAGQGRGNTPLVSHVDFAYAGKERSCRRFRTPESVTRVTSLALLLHPKFSELIGWGAFFRIVAQLIEHLADKALFFLANAVARLVLSRLTGKAPSFVPGSLCLGKLRSGYQLHLAHRMARGATQFLKPSFTL